MAIKTQLIEGEQIIKEEIGVHAVNKIRAFRGKIYLTNKRVIFEKLPALAYVFGTIGVTIAELLNIYKPDLAIDLSVITGYEQCKRGLNKRCILFKTSDGKEYKFTLTSKYEDWASVLPH